MKYNITFNCEGGNYKLSECKRFPRQKDIEQTAEDLEGVGIGKLKKITIDIIEL